MAQPFIGRNLSKARIFFYFLIPLMILLSNNLLPGASKAASTYQEELNILRIDAKPGDQVFFGFENSEIEQMIASWGVTVHRFSDPSGFSSALESWLQSQCSKNSQVNDRVFWFWNPDDFLRLGEAARLAFFFFEFRGFRPNITDKLFELEIIPEKLQLYCDTYAAQKMTGADHLYVIINAVLFPPNNERIKIGKFTWLPDRTFIELDFKKVNIDQWDTKFYLITGFTGSWDYQNKTRNAYQEAISSSDTGSIFLIDRQYAQSTFSDEFLIQCDGQAADLHLNNQRFEQRCPKYASP